jgi:DeoR family transcriptional regulator, suf operon transcriptional repressor
MTTGSTQDTLTSGGRQAILRALLENRDGLTADEIAARLSVTRSAVHQHIVGLERDGLVTRKALARRKGRPSHVYSITEDGIHEFPKRYDWFSALLLGVLSERLGEDDLRNTLDALGKKIGGELKLQLAGSDSDVSAADLASAMSDLGYVARAVRNLDGGEEIQAFNCVYHHLAAEHPEVCDFDLALIEAATGKRPEHAECMVRGGGSCRFKFAKGDGAN